MGMARRLASLGLGVWRLASLGLGLRRLASLGLGPSLLWLLWLRTGLSLLVDRVGFPALRVGLIALDLRLSAA